MNHSTYLHIACNSTIVARFVSVLYSYPSVVHFTSDHEICMGARCTQSTILHTVNLCLLFMLGIKCKNACVANIKV